MSVESADSQKAATPSYFCPHCRITSYNILKCEQCNSTDNVKIDSDSKPTVQLVRPTQNFADIGKTQLLVPPKSVKVGVLCPHCRIISYNPSKCERCNHILLENILKVVVCDFPNAEPSGQSTAPCQNALKVGGQCPYCGVMLNNISKCDHCNRTLPADKVEIVLDSKTSNHLVKPAAFSQNFTGTKLSSPVIMPPKVVRVGAMCPHCLTLSFSLSKCERCNSTFHNVKPVPGLKSPKRLVKSTVPLPKLTLLKVIRKSTTHKFKDVNLHSKSTVLTHKFTDVKLQSLSVLQDQHSLHSIFADNDNKQEKKSMETHPTMDTDFAAVEEPTCCQSFVNTSQTPTLSDNENEQKEKSRTAIYPTVNVVAAEFKDSAFEEEPLSFAGKYTACVEGGGLQEEAMDAPTTSYIYLLMLCKTLQIGTYKVIRSEKVVLSTKGLVMRVPLPSDQNVIVNIPISDICRFMVSFSHTMPVLFLNLSTNGGSKVRKALHMNDSNNKSFYFDPSSRDATLRHIILLPENITEDFKTKLTRIVDISRTSLVHICVGPELKLPKKPACVVPEIVTLSSDEEE